MASTGVAYLIIEKNLPHGGANQSESTKPKATDDIARMVIGLQVCEKIVY